MLNAYIDRQPDLELRSPSSTLPSASEALRRPSLVRPRRYTAGCSKLSTSPPRKAEALRDAWREGRYGAEPAYDLRFYAWGGLTSAMIATLLSR